MAELDPTKDMNDGEEEDKKKKSKDNNRKKDKNTI